MRALHVTALTFAFSSLLSLSSPAPAVEPVRVGFLSTMSGPGGYFGSEAHDGFMLLVQSKNGRLGGLPAEVIVADDQINPELARQTAERLVKKDRVDFVAGTVYGNVMMAAVPVVAEAERFFIGTVAGPSELAGASCNPWYFTVGYQNDAPHEAIGKYMQEKGLRSVVTIVPNFVSGRDAVVGLKRQYKGSVALELYTKINQLDYGAEIAQVRAADPDGVFIFLPGGMGINFIKQYQQNGLLGKIPLFGFGFNFENDVIAAVGEAVVGAYNALQWGADLDNPANKAFVQAFEREYKREPSAYAALGYDTAQLIDAAVRDVGGKLDAKDKLRRALEAANFKSVRGSFKFNTNHMPIQSFYLRQVVNDGGHVHNKTLGVILPDYADAFAKTCTMH
jgi:branched-chain amino acid transport system substrate-binding protein